MAVFNFCYDLTTSLLVALLLSLKLLSLMEDMKDSSGTKLKRAAEVWEGYTVPAEYLVMVEFEDLNSAQRGMPHVNVKPEILMVHGMQVLNNCMTMPTVRISDSMFSEQTYREILQSS